MLALQFTQGRVIRELGREGTLPYSLWFASNRPSNAPFVGSSLKWAVSLTAATLPPPGNAFNFVLQLNSYTTVLINVDVSAGLLFLHTDFQRACGHRWTPPFRAWTSAVVYFFLSNVFLLLVPLVPPTPGHAVYVHTPYFLHVVVALGIALSGGTYYFIRCVYLPRKGGYALVREVVQQKEGGSWNVFRKVRVGHVE